MTVCYKAARRVAHASFGALGTYQYGAFRIASAAARRRRQLSG